MSSYSLDRVYYINDEEAYQKSKQQAIQQFGRMEEELSIALDKLQDILNGIVTINTKSLFQEFQNLKSKAIDGITQEKVARQIHINEYNANYKQANNFLEKIKLSSYAIESAIGLGDIELLIKELRKLFGIDFKTDYKEDIKIIKNSAKLPLKVKEYLLKYFSTIKDLKKVVQELNKTTKIIKNTQDFNDIKLIKQLSDIIPDIEQYIEKNKEIKIDLKKQVELSTDTILQSQIKNRLFKIKAIDENKYEELSDKLNYQNETSEFRLKAIENMLKKEYYELYTLFYEDKLYRSELKNIKSPKLKAKIDSLLTKKYITKNEYDKIIKEYEQLNSTLNDQDISDKIISTFKEKGYSFIYIDDTQVESLKNGDKVIIDTSYSNEYKVELSIKNSNLETKLVRFVDKNHIKNEYDEEKDMEIAEKWCDDYSDILISIQEEFGIRSENIKRVSPFIGVEYREIKENLKKVDQKQTNILQRATPNER